MERKKEFIKKEFARRDSILLDVIKEESKGVENHPLYLRTLVNCEVFQTKVKQLTKKAVMGAGDIEDPLVVRCFDSYEESIKNAIKALFKMLKMIIF